MLPFFTILPPLRGPPPLLQGRLSGGANHSPALCRMLFVSFVGDNVLDAPFCLRRFCGRIISSPTVKNVVCCLLSRKGGAEERGGGIVPSHFYNPSTTAWSPSRAPREAFGPYVVGKKKEPQLRFFSFLIIRQGQPLGFLLPRYRCRFRQECQSYQRG